MDKDIKFMQMALKLAELGNTSPNPKVGCIIVKNNKIIGKGYHKKAGMPHAEIEALNAAGKNAKNATMYVTLEPCSHYGKTPPCTDAIIKAGIKKVIIAMEDPNPIIKGIESLKENKIDVETGILEKEARNINKPFIKYITSKMPFVILKAGITLDGKIATKSGESKYITCEDSLKKVHELRNQVDAVMVGINTVLKDNPMLNCRIENGRDPLRIIIDSRLKLPINANVLRDNNVIIATTTKYDKDKMEYFRLRKIKIIVCGHDKVDLRLLMSELGRKNIVSVLLEGGSELNASAIKDGIVDKVMFFIAPKLMAGKDTIPVIGGEGISSLNELLHLNEINIEKIGEDILVEGYL